ncbi:MAG: inositol-3-phosphate synthase [Lacipirellulaceae bacterium]
MAKQRVGLWLVGARGGVATTVTVGLAALARGDAPATGLLTESLGPLGGGLGLTPWDDFVVGGHEVRAGSLAESARELETQHGALPPGSAERYAAELAAIDARVRPGVVFRSGGAIDALAEGGYVVPHGTAREAIDAIHADLAAFVNDHQLASLVVVIVSSTEPPTDASRVPPTWAAVERSLGSTDCPLRASSLYAIAAIECGAALVNFTPSQGADLPALEELALARSVPHAGRDGKTGETLLKSALAPMFAARRLEVLSWVSHNILGNRDGSVLADPEHKRAKVESKERLLETMLGYRPQSLVSIEHVASMGDWKTAWDHVHFRGFLGVPMSLQFTWQGCDSALAAPLVLDLARLVEVAARRGESGVVAALGVFFKTPQGSTEHALAEQVRALEQWLRGER